MTPNPSLKAHYQRLLLAYPSEYRRHRGEEMLETLLATAEPEQSRPKAREACSLLLEGLRTRAGSGGRLLTRSGCWLGGLYLAVVLLLVRRAYDIVTASVISWPDYHRFLSEALRGDTQYLPQVTEWLLGAPLAIAAVFAILRRRLILAITMTALLAGVQYGDVFENLLSEAPTASIRSIVNLSGELLFSIVVLMVLLRRDRRCDIPPWPSRVVVALLAVTAPLASRIFGDNGDVYRWAMVLSMVIAVVAVIVDVRIPVAVGVAQAVIVGTIVAVYPDFATSMFRPGIPPTALIYLLVSAVPLAVAIVGTTRLARL